MKAYHQRPQNMQPRDLWPVTGSQLPCQGCGTPVPHDVAFAVAHILHDRWPYRTFADLIQELNGILRHDSDPSESDSELFCRAVTAWLGGVDPSALVRGLRHLAIVEPEFRCAHRPPPRRRTKAKAQPIHQGDATSPKGCPQCRAPLGAAEAQYMTLLCTDHADYSPLGLSDEDFDGIWYTVEDYPHDDDATILARVNLAERQDLLPFVAALRHLGRCKGHR
jgi:hypothetical protein